jgi:hypothetical protein
MAPKSSLDPESIKSRTATLLKAVTLNDHPLLILSCTVKNAEAENYAALACTR